MNAEQFIECDAVEPEELQSIPTPRIGFIGTIRPEVDFRTLEAVAQKRKDWSFLFIGPVTDFADDEKLAAMDNVHFVGSVDHSRVPAFCEHLDLGIIPYKQTKFTRYTFPSKMAEYLAAGLPVLASDLSEIRPYDDVVGIYRTPDEFVNQAEVHMERRGDAEIQKRRDLAKQLSWNEIVGGMIEVMKRTL